MLSGGYSMSKLNLYNPDVGFSKQLSDTNFQGFNAGLSWCYLFPVNKGKDDLILGASLEIERGNDYANLSKVDIKNVQFASDSAGHERYINSINQNGSIYAQGAYQEYITEQFRVNMAYIPSFLKSKEKNPIAILFYPSVNYSAIFAPMYNFGFGLRFLKKGSPTISIAGLYIEFNDITDAQKKLEGFVKHTITAGLTASLDVPNVK